MGGMAEPVLKRVAEISDGWFPSFSPAMKRATRSIACALI